jgi:hypothetical protein
MNAWNRDTNPRTGLAGKGAQAVIAVSIAATMLIGGGYVAPTLAQGGYDDAPMCHRQEEENICRPIEVPGELIVV